ncbi:MAG TPA: hypothetical protein V6D35_15595 [Candidatus Sericytochromatia bacterium]
MGNVVPSTLLLYEVVWQRDRILNLTTTKLNYKIRIIPKYLLFNLVSVCQLTKSPLTELSI